MLKEFVEKIVDLAKVNTLEVDGVILADKEMEVVATKKNRIKSISVTGLDSVCQLVKNENQKTDEQIFVRVKNHVEVEVFTGLDEDLERSFLYRCEADTPRITKNGYMGHEQALIELRSQYIPNDGSAYLLQLLSSISSESKVSSVDNGVTQQVEAKSGIALNSMVEIKPRVILKPFRTFIEVEQPESEFLLRVSQSGEIGLFEADGGVWKLEATRNVAKYFEEHLADLVESRKVVVIR